jgi:spore coat protein A, manganese oxidase
MVIHVHGLTTTDNNDGKPLGYITMNGTQGSTYSTTFNYSNHSAVFHYENDNIPGMYLYHDHTLTMTRLNVISGLKGLYEILP